MRTAMNLSAIAPALVLAGCANWNSIHHDFRPDNGDSMSIDAKQRVVVSINKSNKLNTRWTAFCAEPSPDALSALSASLGADVAVGGKALGLALASQEGAASIGLRTQSITILRDGMYRLCEGYASGALDDVGFARLQRRYQAIMLGLLAIEQLSGATVASQALISGNSGARLGQGLSQVTALITESRVRVATTQANSKAKAAALDAASQQLSAADDAMKKATTDAKGAETEALKTAKANLETASKAKSDAEIAKQKAAITEAAETGELANLESLRKDLDRASAIAATAGSLVGVSRAATGPPDAASHATMAKAVKDIVTTIVSHDYTREACMDLITGAEARDAVAAKVQTDLLKLQMNFCIYAMQVETVRGGANSDGQRRALTTADHLSIETYGKTFSDMVERIIPSPAASASSPKK